MGQADFANTKNAMSDLNPMGTRGFEFVEFTGPDPATLDRTFRLLGFQPIAQHRSKPVTLYRQGDVNFILNAEKDGFAGALPPPMVPASARSVSGSMTPPRPCAAPRRSAPRCCSPMPARWK